LTISLSIVLNYQNSFCLTFKGISSDEFELTLSQGLATVLGIVETHGSSTGCCGGFHSKC